MKIKIMISEIIEACPPWFEKVLELIITSNLSSEERYKNHFKVSIDAKFYIDDLCWSGSEPFCYDWLHWIFILLKKLWVIKDFKRVPYVDNGDYNHVDVLDDLGFEREKNWSGWFIGEVPWDEAILYMKHGWPYYVSCDKEKIMLFRDIVFRKKKKYICRIGMIKFLINFTQKIDIESFLDWMEFDEIYHFNDIEVLIYSVASSSRLNIAKMYYYVWRFIDNQEDDELFKFEMALEKEVVLDNTDYNYPDNFKYYYFDAKLDNQVTPKKERNIKSIISGSVSYDPTTNQMKIWEKYIPFKWAKLQIIMLEYLIENRDRSVSGEEVKRIGISDIKITTDDIKKKIRGKWISQKECKELFHSFEDDGVKYCRILL